MTASERREPAGEDRGRDALFRRRASLVGVTATLVLAGLFLLWQVTNIVLVLFAGVLLAIFLHGISAWIEAHTPLSGGGALLVTILGLALILGLLGWYAAPAIANQASQLGPQLRDAAGVVQERISGLPLGEAATGDGNLVNRLLGLAGDVVGRVSGVFSSTIGFLTNLVVLLFVGLYFAYEPQLYVEGALKLLPKGRRPRMRQVIGEMHASLRWWLVGRLAMMAIIGTLTTIGLLLLGVPLALVLGLLAGLLAFIPYFGPLLALAPAVLLAFTSGPLRALYVFLLYAGIQIVESYFLTPMMEKRVVSLPPVLLISSQVVLGALLGFWGLLLAPALVVTGRVAIKKLYVEDVLGDHSVTYVTEEHQGSGAGPSSSSGGGSG